MVKHENAVLIRPDPYSGMRRGRRSRHLTEDDLTVRSSGQTLLGGSVLHVGAKDLFMNELLNLALHEEVAELFQIGRASCRERVYVLV